VDKLLNYLRIFAAAEYWGALPNTLCNWVNAEKIVTLQNTVYDNRIFKEKTLMPFSVM
jgi:hypothetical protein